ncbi:hypothetical protein JANAI62_22680 [Jannaschia pagri]|uniref:Uncharacterized protein n=1 Tax=Jannaschia pagri TaxID=2829797 RepID=A0ABQ4NML1_9RHOB|nr:MULTISPECIES: hypothetical protein [unclassified Jannaschia]GIT91811.1 hypothetical protein JANAI61_22690 [Jannaschia sp. AI_61]GIT95645.1 hypothetical protein JANAI62_22680 [Jannaschia sp. AI_62]
MIEETSVVAGDTDLGDVEGRARSALRSMETLRDVLDRKALELAETPIDGIKPDDVLKLSRDLAKAVSQAVDLEGKVADAGRIERGGDGLDLASARAEVRRRLDLLLERG